MIKKHNNITLIMLILVLIHFTMSILINALFPIIDTGNLSGGIGAASPLMCFMGVGYGNDDYILLYAMLGVSVAVILVVMLILAIVTRKYYLYSVAVISDVLARIVLLITDLGYREMLLSWTGMLLNLLLFVTMLLLNRKNGIKNPNQSEQS